MKSQIKKYSLYFLALFMAMFSFRLAYGYWSRSSSYEQSIVTYGNSDGDGKRNYASSKISVRKNLPGASVASYIEQKFEKVGAFFASTSSFDDDNKKIRQIIEQKKALIQYENNKGTKGNRSLFLSIGVSPELFDQMCEEVQKIGDITEKNISKTDKTNEFKTLNAKRASLEKPRNSLVDLKSKGGKIDEYITLENRILEIEEQLQDLGVSLGDFDAENEFCTVKFTLSEYSKYEITLIHRIKVALEWTIKYYAVMIFIIGMVTLVSYLGVLIYTKLVPKG